MENRHVIYEGTTKILYEGPDEGTLLLHFKENNKDQTVKFGTGSLNNRISAFLMSKLKEIGLVNHFIKYNNMREQVVKSLDMLPFEVHVLNSVTTALSQRLHLPEGSKISRPIVEYHMPQKSLEGKNQETLLTEDHLLVLGWITPTEIEEIVAMSLRLNDFLMGLFTGIGLYVADFKIRFGRYYNKFTDDMVIMLGDALTPQSCTLWHINLPGKMGTSFALSSVDASYEIAKRLNLLPDTPFSANNFEHAVPKNSKKLSSTIQTFHKKKDF